MQDDPIVDEVRQVRQAHAARFHFDLDAIFQDLKEQERRSGDTFVRFPARRMEPAAREWASREGSPNGPSS